MEFHFSKIFAKILYAGSTPGSDRRGNSPLKVILREGEEGGRGKGRRKREEGREEGREKRERKRFFRKNVFDPKIVRKQSRTVKNKK